jgi:hypothetical protein
MASCCFCRLQLPPLKRLTDNVMSRNIRWEIQRLMIQLSAQLRKAKFGFVVNLEPGAEKQATKCIRLSGSHDSTCLIVQGTEWTGV